MEPYFRNVSADFHAFFLAISPGDYAELTPRNTIAAAVPLYGSSAILALLVAWVHF